MHLLFLAIVFLRLMGVPPAVTWVVKKRILEGTAMSLLALRIAPKVVEGGPRGNNRTNLGKGASFFVSIDVSISHRYIIRPDTNMK